MKVFIVAGEASGDVLGAHVMAGLKARYGSTLEIAGLGGEHMQAKGLVPIFPLADVAVVGLVEVLRRYPLIRRRLRDLKQAIGAFAPHVLLTIDAQGLSYRLGKHFKGQNKRLIQLVAPTVWAWKPERAAKAASYLDHVACLFPFEPKYFEAEGLPATFVGHPVLAQAQADGAVYARARAGLGLAEGEIWLALLPGSRAMEVRQLAPIFSKALVTAQAEGLVHGLLIPVAGPVADQVKAWAQSLPLPVRLLEQAADKAHLAAADLALAASGTVSLELSALGIPAILAYRLHPLTYACVNRQLTIDFMGLTNLLAGKLVQPEFRLNEVPETALTRGLCALLADPDARAQIRKGQFAALEALHIDDGLDFGQRVANLI